MADSDFTIWVSDGFVKIEGPGVLTVAQALELAGILNARFGAPASLRPWSRWSAAADTELRTLYQNGNSLRAIATAMGRTVVAIRRRITELKIANRRSDAAAHVAKARAALAAKRKAA